MRLLRVRDADFGSTEEALAYLEECRATYIRLHQERIEELARQKAEYREKVATLQHAAKQLAAAERPAMTGRLRVAVAQKRVADAQADVDKQIVAAPAVAAPVHPPGMSAPLMRVIDSIRVKTTPYLHLDPRTGNSAALFGSSKSGKTTAMMQIYRKYYAGQPGQPDTYIATLFAQNIQIGAYGAHKKLLRCAHFDARAMTYLRLQHAIQKRTNNEYRFVNLVDDFIDVRYNTMINNLILTYRNSDISTMICLQSAKLLSKAARSSVNNILLFGCNLAEGRIDLMKTFLRPYFLEMGLRSDDDMMYLYKHATAGHGYIQIHPATGALDFYRLAMD